MLTRIWATRKFWARSESAGLLALCLLAGAGLVFASSARWVAVAVVALFMLFVVGALALFAARRSRVATDRIVAHAEKQNVATAENIQRLRVEMLYSPARRATQAARPWRQETSSFPGSSYAKPLYSASGYLPVYLELGEEKPDHRWLDNTILRNASTTGRDLLAWRASGGLYDCAQIERLLRRIRDKKNSSQARSAIAALDPEWAQRLARIMGLQALQADDRLNALTLYAAIYAKHGPAIVSSPHTHARVFQALAYDMGDYALAEEITRKVRCSKYDLPFMLADLRNPFTSSPFADPDRWLDLLNQNFASSGLEPLALNADLGAAPFDMLHCPPAQLVKSGPLISIAMSSWRPGEEIFAAIRSVIAQSWQSWELLVIDDASPSEYGEVLERIAVLDPRIKVLRQSSNGGTYLIRNAAMREARGEFMTFLDSDDWSHPRRLERQIAPLLQNSELMSTTSRALRANAKLVFNLPGVIAQRENASSMMFRLAPVRERIGYFDSVRKGADTEFALRMRRTFGASSHVIVEENLSMIRLTSGSLSREEFKLGWRHPSRAAYRRGYEHWHRSSQARDTPLRMPADVVVRPFPSPRRFMIDPIGANAQARAAYDIVFAADLRHGTDAVRALFDEVRATKRAGHKVAVLHMESFRHMQRIEMEFYWEPIEEAIATGLVDEVLLTDPTAIDTLVVRDFAVLQFASHERSAFDVGRVLVVAGDPPRDRLGRMWYEPSECLRHAQKIFGVRVGCTTCGMQAQDELRAGLAPVFFATADLPEIIDVPEWQAPRRPLQGIPVLGVILDSASDAYPDTPEELFATYAGCGSFQVRVLAEDLRPSKARGAPENWTFFDAGIVGREAFLAGCDFYVRFDRHDDAPPRRSRDVLEAMASGAVVVLPTPYAQLYENAAVYCDNVQLADAIQALYSKPAAFEAQVERGRQYLAQSHAPDAFVSALFRL
ncbi:glycosyltransferase involved in cell wall biosynthesis [Luteimonas cucumeris]|uniref:Glycosyltransferase involved in cell wall biosynthesis n=2 Tax=Luteimonas cucumeris TaxID=985012 RepID=A0A562L5P4_9GAMM|nr:glycosyltransferase involved in cell wall biosynthesis [Luteimonas cucumeris]